MFEEFGHFFQEASSKTKINRDKDKIRDDLGIQKGKHSSYGIITDKASGKSKNVKLEFDPSKPTYVSNTHRDYDKGVFYVVMNINPNDLNRGHGLTKYFHEKNHVLQDLRKTRELVKDDDGEYKHNITYTHQNDIDDHRLAQAFINKHANEIKNDHTRDPEEYIADLNAARKRGFNETIKTLEDLKSTSNSPSSKHLMSLFKKCSKEIVNGKYNDQTINALKESYEKMLKKYEFDLKYLKESVYSNNNDIQKTEKIIKIIKKQLSSDDNFKDSVILKANVLEFEKLCDEHDTDLRMRILFLRDMKRLKDKNDIFHEGYVLSLSDNDTVDPLKKLINDHEYQIHQESYNSLESLYDSINANLSETFNEYIISESVIYDVMDYVLIDLLEKEE